MSNEQMRYYLNNPLLKAARVQMEFESWQIEELVKCAQDPIYFAENYCQINNGDKGLHKIELYGYQPKLINTVMENNRVIALQPRQTGKCCSYKTTISIKNKYDGRVYEMLIGDFYEWRRLRRLVEERFGATTIQNPKRHANNQP